MIDPASAGRTISERRKELAEIHSRVAQHIDLALQLERLRRWITRTTDSLTSDVHPAEGRRFAQKVAIFNFMPSTQPNIMKQIRAFDDHLLALQEELVKNPGILSRVPNPAASVPVATRPATSTTPAAPAVDQSSRVGAEAAPARGEPLSIEEVRSRTHSGGLIWATVGVLAAVASGVAALTWTIADAVLRERPSPNASRSSTAREEIPARQRNGPGDPHRLPAEFGFKETGIKELESSGWRIHNLDRALWDLARDRFSKPGVLTLLTGRGDYWLKETDERCPVSNILVRDITGVGDFVAKTQLLDFHPNLNWQQAGLVVFGEGGTYARLTIAFDDYNTPGPPIVKSQVVIGTVGRPDPIERAGESFGIREGLLNSAELAIRFRGDRATFLVRYLDPSLASSAVRSIHEQDLGWKPIFVGLTAFHGCTAPTNPPVALEIREVPAYFRFLKLEPIQ